MFTPFRCGACHRLLAQLGASAEVQIKCPRCGTLNHMKAESLLVERHERPAQGNLKCTNPMP